MNENGDKNQVGNPNDDSRLKFLLDKAKDEDLAVLDSLDRSLPSAKNSESGIRYYNGDGSNFQSPSVDIFKTANLKTLASGGRANAHPTLGQLADEIHARAMVEQQSKVSVEDAGDEYDYDDDSGINDPALCAPGNEHTGRWTRKEHELFLEGLKKYGKEWKKVASMVKTRTVVQTRTHAQKYFQKFAKASGGIPGDDFSVDFMSTGNSNSHRLSAAEMAYVASTASSIGKRVSSMSAPQKRSRKSDGSDVGSLDILASTTKAHGPLLTSASSGSHTQESISLGGMRESYGFPSTLSMNQSKPPALIIPDLHDFPQPSPAACGKRKIAELAAAQVLAGSSSNQDIAGAQVLSMMRDAAFAPGEIVRKRKTLPSLSIVNPDNLDVTGKVPNQGSGPPLTPWDDEVVKLGERVMEVATNQSKYSSIATPSDQRKFLSALRECIRQCNIHALEALIDSAERSSFESANIGLGLSPADTFDEAEFSKREVDVAAALAAAVGGGEMEKEDSASYKDAPPTASQSATKATSMSTTPLSSVCSDSGIRSHHRASGALIRTLNLCGTSGITVLMEASCLPTDRDKGVDQDKILEMCRILVMNGCSPSVIGRTGQTCLHFAASVGYEKVGRLMLNHGCPVNIADEAGDTAAHIAAKYGHGRFLDMLADFGANCHLRNASSRAALDVAGVNIKATDVESWIRTRYELRRIMLSAEPRLRTLVLYHEDCLHHITRRASDWEAKDRLVSIMQRLSDRRIFPEFEIEISSQFDKATVELLQRVHSAEYIAFVNQLSKQVQPSPSMINDGRMASNSMNYNKLLAFTPQVQKAIFHQPQEELKQSEYCDTTFSPGTLRAARRAAGAVAHAVDHVLLGRNRNAFCVVRPPGHHVGHDGLLDGAKSCGFCIFNSVAAGAFHALEAHNCERVAVIDLDIHHGNGTEDIIRRNSKPSRLFFFSLHLYDHDEDSGYEFFPGTGVSDDIAHNIINVPLRPLWIAQDHESKGQNKSHSTLNENGDIHLKAVKKESSESSNNFPALTLEEPSKLHGNPFQQIRSSGRELYRQAIVERLIPALRAFNPSLILLSMGFDAAIGDVGNYRTAGGKSMPGMDMQPEDFEWVTTEVMRIADLCCGGRLVSVLEGGYGSYSKIKKHVPVTRTMSSRNFNSETEENEPYMNREVLSICTCAHVRRLIDPYGPREVTADMMNVYVNNKAGTNASSPRGESIMKPLKSDSDSKEKMDTHIEEHDEDNSNNHIDEDHAFDDDEK